LNVSKDLPGKREKSKNTSERQRRLDLHHDLVKEKRVTRGNRKRG